MFIQNEQKPITIVFGLNLKEPVLNLQCTQTTSTVDSSVTPMPLSGHAPANGDLPTTPPSPKRTPGGP